MYGPSAAIVEQFAEAFAQKWKGHGLTRNEIVTFFREYSNNVVDPDTPMTKQEIFGYCLRRLPIDDQYRALIDLCCQPPESKNALPDEAEREALKEILHAHSYSNGVSIRAVTLDSWPIKREWIKAASRVERDPAGAVTSARTTLERTCREVLKATELDERPNDLGRLVKATRRALNLRGGADGVATGVATIVNAIAEASNAAGDRHAGEGDPGVPIAEARLMCDVSLALSLYLLDQLKVQSAPEA